MQKPELRMCLLGRTGWVSVVTCAAPAFLQASGPFQEVLPRTVLELEWCFPVEEHVEADFRKGRWQRRAQGKVVEEKVLAFQLGNP